MSKTKKAPKKSETQSKILGFRCSDDMFTKVTLLAAKENRSESNYIRIIVENAIKNKKI